MHVVVPVCSTALRLQVNRMGRWHRGQERTCINSSVKWSQPISLECFFHTAKVIRPGC